MTDLDKMQHSLAIARHMDALARQYGIEPAASWDDYKAGLVTLGADAPSLEAARRCAVIAPSCHLFRLATP